MTAGAASPMGVVMRVAILYPDRMNLYADRGNVLVLAARCRRRGIAFEATPVHAGGRFPAVRPDLVYIGGGQDHDQRACGADLQRHADDIASAAAAGSYVLGICGGYQLLGHEYRTPAGTVAGIGLLDAVTTRPDGERLVGNAVVAVTDDARGRRLVGFENHQGRTELGAGCRPLGTVLAGSGNNGSDGSEGAVAGTVIGTYLHGPLLARNAWFADHLIERTVGIELPPLPDRFEAAVHERAVSVAFDAAKRS